MSVCVWGGGGGGCDRFSFLLALIFSLSTPQMQSIEGGVYNYTTQW